MNLHPDGLPAQKRTRFLTNSRSLHDLPRQAIPPPRICGSVTHQPAYAYPARPVSFCPTVTPAQEAPSPINRRFSELPAQLDLGLPFASFLDGDNFPWIKGRHSDCESPEVPENLSRFYGPSFSSGLSETIQSIENSSFTSSVTAPTSPVDADAASSIFYECTASDFPEPPPIGSPALRRMQSSPWFLSFDNVDSVLSVPGRGGRIGFDRHGGTSCMSSSEFNAESTIRNKNSAPAFRSCQAAEGLQTTHGASERVSKQRKSDSLDGRLASAANGKRLSDWNNNSTAANLTGVSQTRITRLPKIIRKMASMRSESHKTADIPNESVTTFHGPGSRDWSILRRSQDPLRANFNQNPELNKNLFFWTSRATQAPKMVQSRSEVYENHSLRPSSRIGSSFGPDSSWKENINKSFIDLGPDRTQSKGRRENGAEKMRFWLSKANALFRSKKKVQMSGLENGRQ